jgi:hypothetical protein
VIVGSTSSRKFQCRKGLNDRTSRVLLMFGRKGRGNSSSTVVASFKVVRDGIGEI